MPPLPHQINELLEASSVWGAYRDQKHDLFITATATAGYLTGSTLGTAGYLTAGTNSTGTSSSMLTTPPPIAPDPPEDEGRD